MALTMKMMFHISCGVYTEDVVLSWWILFCLWQNILWLNCVR